MNILNDSIFKLYISDGNQYILVNFNIIKELNLCNEISNKSLINKTTKIVYLENKHDSFIFLNKFNELYGYTPYIDEIIVPNDHFNNLNQYTYNITLYNKKTSINSYIVKEKSGCIYELKTDANTISELSDDIMIDYIKPIDVRG